MREEGSQSLGGRGPRKVSCWVKGMPDPLLHLVALFFLFFLGSSEQKAVQALCGSSPLTAGTRSRSLLRELLQSPYTTHCMHRSRGQNRSCSVSLLFPQIAASPSPARSGAHQAGSQWLPAFPSLPLAEDDRRKRADNAH